MVPVDQWSSRLANALLGLGLQAGDRVAILAPNCATYLAFFFACSKSGLVGVPLSIRLTPAELHLVPALRRAQGDARPRPPAGLGRELHEAVGAIGHLAGCEGDHDLALDLDEL